MGAQDVHLDFHTAPGALCEFTVVEVLLYVHRNRNLINGGSRGRPPRPSRSSGDLFEEYLFGLFKITQLSPAENSGRLTRVRHSSRKRSATLFYRSVQYVCAQITVYGC